MATYGRIFPEDKNAMGFRLFAQRFCVLSQSLCADFANSGPVEPEIALLEESAALPDVEVGGRVECIANATASGTVDERGWMRLVLFGEHPYGQKDVQVFDAPAAAALVRRFKTAANALVSAVFRTERFLPVYHGHPDHPQFAANGHDDFTLRAKITDMEVRDDGLYIRPEFTDAGNALLTAGQKLWWSPRWLTEFAREDTGGGKRYWRPFKLISAGLWPTPNIYGSAANARPNSNEDTPMPEWIKKILTALGFTEDQANAVVAQSEDAPTGDNITSALTKRLDAANGFYDLQIALMRALGYSDDEINLFREEAAGAPTLEQITQRLTERLGTAAQQQTDVANAQSRITTLEADLKAERTARAELVVDRAISDRRLSPADRDTNVRELADADDFANASRELLAKPELLPSGGTAASVAARKGEMQDAANARHDFNQGLEDFANSKGLDLDRNYTNVYARFKATPAGKALLEKMRETGSQT